MEKARKEYGDIFTSKVASMISTDLVFVSDPESMQYILTNDRQIFSAPGESNRILSTLMGDYSVILLDGEEHKKRRQLLTPPFHGESIRSYGDLITTITERNLTSIPTDKPFAVRSVMQLITLEVIMQVVFGLTEGEDYDILKHHLATMLDIFQVPAMAAVLFYPWLQVDLGPWSPWGKFIRSRQIIDNIIYKEIDRRRQDSINKGNDILSLLMSATDTEGNPLTDKELRDELITMLFAGHETTATAMSWALYWTHRYPEVKEKIIAEIETLGANPSPLDIVRLPYLTAVCQETLRIHPVGMLTFPRVVEKPVHLGGYDLPVGTVLMPCIYLAHHRPETYADDAEFKPERFLEKQYSPYEFLPFGGGVRRCIGEALAWFELKIVVASALSGYNLSLVHTDAEKPRRRGLTLGPSRGVKMRLNGKRVRSIPSPEPALSSN